MRRPGRILVAAILATGLGAPVLVQWMRNASAVPVEVAGARMARLAPSVLATGVLAYTSQVTLMPQVLGRVSAIRVAEGQQVHAGDHVLELDARDASAEVAQFVAAQSQARIDVMRDARESDYRASRADRYRLLRQQGMVTAAQYDAYAHEDDLGRLQLQNSRQALLRASAQLAQAREALAKTTILAPMDGQVSSIDTRVGETVVPSVSNVPGSVLLTLSNPSERLAEVEVEETDLGLVQPGQPARVTVASDPDRALPATVQKIAVLPTQEARGRVYKTRLRLNGDASTAFHPGMGCRAEIDVGHAGEVLAIPQQAVLAREDDPRATTSIVLVVVDGVARRRAVTIGQSDDVNVAITSGLSVGDSIVIGPARALRRLQDGQAVRALAAGPAASPARR